MKEESLNQNEGEEEEETEDWDFGGVELPTLRSAALPFSISNVLYSIDLLPE